MSQQIFERLTRRRLIAALGLSPFMASAFAQAANPGRSHEVLMRNAACGDPNELNVFDPPILKIDVGDTVTFVPFESGHNAASKRGMVPEGGPSWNGGVDERLTVTFDTDGTYGYVCVPHYEAGMVGLVLVGDHERNLEQARKTRHAGGARKAFRALFKRVKNGEFERA
ncbi:MAG: pseudoazurin [Pseudomonadota bacterium]